MRKWRAKRKCAAGLTAAQKKQQKRKIYIEKEKNEGNYVGIKETENRRR